MTMTLAPITKGSILLREIVLAALLLSACVSANDYKNVYGNALQPCSQDGMALTGYTRSGYCVEQEDDSGSHHICIDLSSLGGNNGDENFCTVTGQSDWCSNTNMPCQEDTSDYSCPVENWCVCQWAFSSYVYASGCDNIQTVVCDSINLEALLAYQNMASNSNAHPKYKVALECLVDRCGIESSTLQTYQTNLVGSEWTFQRVLQAALFVGSGVIIFGLLWTKLFSQRSTTIDLNAADGTVLDHSTDTKARSQLIEKYH